jgi:hypothetical protein
LGIPAVGLLLLHSPGIDLCWITDPQLETEFHQQPFEPARVSGRFHPDAHADTSTLQVAIEPLRLPMTVVQLQLAALPGVQIQKSDLLKTRVVIYAYQ